VIYRGSLRIVGVVQLLFPFQLRYGVIVDLFIDLRLNINFRKYISASPGEKKKLLGQKASIPLVN
jgi:hypothetical protein